ncbi:MAG: TauD/TfdA family dioxygenase [Pseudomonadota bacterium]
MTELTLTLAPAALAVTWPGGDRQDYPLIWLRDNDPTPARFHPDTHERTGDLLDIPALPEARDAEFASDTLVINWTDGGESRYPLAWLAANRPGRASDDPASLAPQSWRCDLDVPRHDARGVLHDDTALLAWLKDTAATGLSILENVAAEDGAGLALAKRVGFLRQTNFGVSFEVVNKPDPNNLAYTALPLPLHTDLPNQELPPGYQFLHCIANEATGGGSLFADGVAMADALRAADPEAFHLLAEVPIPFRFHDGETDLRIHRTVLNLRADGSVHEVKWNAHIAGAFDMAPDLIQPYYDAYRAFMALARDQAFQVQLKLASGEMVVFDNRRVLHGREAFDPSTGFRHLQGCYVDRGEFLARIRVLSRH